MWSAQVRIAKPSENVVEGLELVLSRDEWQRRLTMFAEQFGNPTSGAVARCGRRTKLPMTSPLRSMS